MVGGGRGSGAGKGKSWARWVGGPEKREGVFSPHNNTPKKIKPGRAAPLQVDCLIKEETRLISILSKPI